MWCVAVLRHLVRVSGPRRMPCTHDVTFYRIHYSYMEWSALRWRFSRSENRGDMSAAMSAAEGARENNLANSQKDKVTANLGGKRAEQMVMVSAQAAPRSIPRADPSTKEVSNVSIYPKAHGGQGSYFLDLRQSSAACQLRGCGRS